MSLGSVLFGRSQERSAKQVAVLGLVLGLRFLLEHSIERFG